MNNLIVEITRKCNLHCDHCLRGDSQNKMISFSYIDSLLSQIDYISNVTFTGGEPSLNVPAIDYFLNECKKRQIGIGSFYIATNGVDISENFIIACLRLFSYSDEKDMCIVHVSNDYFHAVENNYTTELLDGLSFFSRKFDRECDTYNNYRNLIKEGRAKNITNVSRINTEHPIKTKENFDDADIYLNCNGKIINGCNWSYTSQNKKILCDVSDLKSYYDSLPD